mgnify:CR=1 FL=1
MGCSASIPGTPTRNAPQAPYASNVSSKSIPFKHTGAPLSAQGPTPEPQQTSPVEFNRVGPATVAGETALPFGPGAMSDAVRAGTERIVTAKPNDPSRPFTP